MQTKASNNMPVLAVGNKFITDDKEKAEEFAQHFNSIGSNKTHSRKDVEIAKEFNTLPLYGNEGTRKRLTDEKYFSPW